MKVNNNIKKENNIINKKEYGNIKLKCDIYNKSEDKKVLSKSLPNKLEEK